MSYKHILFVEDEPAQHDLFETAVSDWNRQNVATQRKFSYHIAKAMEEAVDALAKMRFDAALFDLRIKNGNGGNKTEPSGNSLARTALSERGIPVAIMSANTAYLEEDVRTSGAVAVFDKNDAIDETGNAYDRAIDWFGSQWDMMEVLAASRKAMEGSAADIFLRRLWPRWKMFAELGTADQKELTQIVTRQYVSHMADLLGLDNPGNATWHPFENYVSPALMSERAHTGDIFKLDGALWVVLTPQCDMATQKVENTILARCVSGIGEWAERVAALKAKASNSQVEKAEKFLGNLVNQNLPASQHFLPPLPGETEPLLVHFSAIRTIPLFDLNAGLERRIASIATPFLANIVQRFGAYI